MESLSNVKLPGCSASVSPPIFHSKLPSFPCHSSVPFQPAKSISSRIRWIEGKQRRSVGAVQASQPETTVTADVDRWLLEPVGDGDSRHIGYKVELPAAIEIGSTAVTVGRVPEKADVVIPVATVSGVHALIRNKGGNLLVTDLDSTNGTFINDKRLSPGVVAAVAPGSLLTFGDTNLAIFRVRKLENVEAVSKPEQSEGSDSEGETGRPTEAKDPTS
ncbi:hypothetical protein Tsubulata_012955 [Turnera subulata]|uniref:FHA domain-containing protein n=1 Tax=Turnera subulata TaxID=218843 RepID=A0A9Q0FNS7_9ROSI|nr:hypothetical protein Tsubulata_012955 [Turnera subulata]